MATTGQLIGYIRVSSADQNTGRQEEQLKGFQPDEVFIDHASGKDVSRPQLQAALKHLRKGDTLIVSSMDRLSRSLADLLRLVKDLTGRGVAIRFIKENLTFTGDDSPMANLLLAMLGSVAQFERELLKERQREGIAIAKTKGKYLGRKHALDANQIASLKDRAKAGEVKTQLAKELGISRATLYTYLGKAA